MLGEAEFDIKKEAAWAISNATSGGRHEQINTLVQAGAIKPLCDLLTCSDPRIITVALEGIENILKASHRPPRHCPLPSSRGKSCTMQGFIQLSRRAPEECPPRLTGSK